MIWLQTSRYLLSDWNTAGSDQKKRDLQFNVGCLLLSSQPHYSSEKKQMENFQTVTFSRYMKHQVKGHLLDPSNFSTKMGKKTPSTVTEMWEDRNNNNKSSTCERACKLLWKVEDWKLMLCVRIKSPWSTMVYRFLFIVLKPFWITL